MSEQRRHILYGVRKKMESWQKIEVSRPVALLLYFQAWLVSQYMWSSNASLLEKCFVLLYELAVVFLICYAQVLMPQSPEDPFIF